MREKKQKGAKVKEKGITLIALVVTIIILLILAGVAIASVTGDNGLFRRAREAVNTYKDSERVEQGSLIQLENEISKELGRGNEGNPQVPEEPETPVESPTSYVGYYADIDGINGIDGIIYADLAVGGSGKWNNANASNYEYSAISGGLKNYSVSDEEVNGVFGKHKVVTSLEGSGLDRFYVMALEDVNPGTYYCWYDAAIDDGGKLDTTVDSVYNDFGDGKENTGYVMEKWTSEAWGTKNCGVYNDLWGAIETKVSEGWFLPSKAEWSAFGDMLYTKFGIDTLNYTNVRSSNVVLVFFTA